MRRILVTLTAPVLLLAQGWRGEEQSIRAQIRGGGGDSGKCTAEVEVDGIAEVAIRGDEGRIRTITGQPARWRRLECNGALPRSMGDFRFRGIDGRGRQDLAQDPRSNNGVAVIRIEDPKGGSEGYTFDIEWRNSGGNWGGSGSGSGWGGGSGGGSGWGGGSGGGSGWGNSNSGSGWGNSGSGWGGNNWNNGWGSNFSYRGRGSGSFSHSNGQRQDLRGAWVTMDQRSGNVEVRFNTNAGQEALQFTGRLQGINGENVNVTVLNGRNQGENVPVTGNLRMTVGNDRRVRWISMDGRAAGGRFNLDYRE